MMQDRYSLLRWVWLRPWMVLDSIMSALTVFSPFLAATLM